MKTAVISDTHNLLRPEVKKIIGECEAVIHAGDVCSEKTLADLRSAMKPGAALFAVRGNCDAALGEKLPLSLEFDLSGFKVFVVHNKKDVPKDIKADIIIFGHSHKYFEEKENNRLWLNPGSCGRRRFGLPVTFALLNIEGGCCSAEKAEIEGEAPGAVPEKDLKKTLRLFLKHMEKGDSLDTICKKLKLDPAFAEQTARIIVTHPGVDAEGIMNKMEVNKIRENKKD